jgi:hypothetical protein
MKIKIPIKNNGSDGYSMKLCLLHPKRKARVFTGHLVLGKKVVITGFCSDACVDDQSGCGGKFRRA